MRHLTRRFFVFGMLATLATVPLQPAWACVSAELHAQIVFDEAPDNIPPGLAAKHFHLTNQVPEFNQWSKRRPVAFMKKSPEMRRFSFIGMGASINPWTHWLMSRLPDWLFAQPKYMPIFAPTSSCTVNFWPLEQKIDQTILIVGRPVSLTTGDPAFVAASYRTYGDRWVTYRGSVVSY